MNVMTLNSNNGDTYYSLSTIVEKLLSSQTDSAVNVKAICFLCGLFLDTI